MCAVSGYCATVRFVPFAYCIYRPQYNSSVILCAGILWIYRNTRNHTSTTDNSKQRDPQITDLGHAHGSRRAAHRDRDRPHSWLLTCPHAFPLRRNPIGLCKESSWPADRQTDRRGSQVWHKSSLRVVTKHKSARVTSTGGYRLQPPCKCGRIPGFISSQHYH